MFEHTFAFLGTTALATLSLSLGAGAQCRVDKLAAASPQDYARFGASVAISGARLVIGETDHQVGSATLGAAHVFELGSAGWTETALLTASDGADFDDFGVAVALDGDTLLVGADAVDGPQSGAVGAVYAFEWNGSQWVETQKLQASDGASGGFFGFSVALEGDTAVIGRFWDSAANVHAGSAYVFQRSGSQWTEQQKLLPTNAVRENDFGWSVALSNQRIVVGASERFSSGPAHQQLGSVFVFDPSTAGWTLSAVLTASNAQPFDQLGISVAIDGDRIVAGAWQDTFYTPTSRNGAAYVFERHAAGWSEAQILTASDGMVQDEFGGSVALQGPWLLVGAPSRSRDYPLWGGVYAFELGATGWTQQKILKPDASSSLAWMGNALAIDGNHAVAGAFIDTVAQYQSGTAYVLGGFDPWRDEGFGLAGSNGVPHLAGRGTLCSGDSASLDVTSARPNSIAVLIRGRHEVDLPFLGGTLVPSRDLMQRGLTTDASGGLTIGDAWPAGIAAGTQLFFQVWIRDGAGPHGASATNGLSGTAP